MSYKFNPFTGTFDLVGTGGSSGPVTSAPKLSITRTASVAIQRGDAVMSISATHVALADASLSTDEATVTGFAENDAAIGELVTIILFGVISDPIFNIFSLNAPLFLDETGGVTDTRRTNGFHTVCGFSLGGDEIFVRINTPIALG